MEEVEMIIILLIIIFTIQLIFSLVYYDDIREIFGELKKGENFLDLNFLAAALAIFCWPATLYYKVFNGKKHFWEKSLREILMPKKAKAKKVLEKLDGTSSQ